jgi:hypothetical protein
MKNIDSFLLWSLAWRTYEQILVESDPSLYPILAEYRIFIQTCSARHLWNSVYSYDVRNRAKKSMTRLFRFDTIDNDIYVSSLDSSTVRNNVRMCNRCHSIWHGVKDCPFPEELSVASSGRSTQNSRQGQGNFNNTGSGSGNYNTGLNNFSGRRANQACYNWNAGRCNLNPCTRLHVCERCGGPEPLPRCQNCNSHFNRPGSGNVNTSQQGSNNPASGYVPAAGRVG